MTPIFTVTLRDPPTFQDLRKQFSRFIVADFELRHKIQNQIAAHHKKSLVGLA